MIGDLRFKKNFYAAFELGVQEKTIQEDYLNFTTKGSFLALGVNYNAYENWVGMSNEVFVGMRYAMSFFNQTLNSYSPNVKGTYFEPVTIATGTSINNKYINLVFWGVANKGGTYDPIMVNLPSGSYTVEANAIEDADSFDNSDIPREYTLDSGTGFLIAKININLNGGVYSIYSVEDLTGIEPNVITGAFLTKTIFTLIDTRVKKNNDSNSNSNSDNPSIDIKDDSKYIISEIIEDNLFD